MRNPNPLLQGSVADCRGSVRVKSCPSLSWLAPLRSICLVDGCQDIPRAAIATNASHPRLAPSEIPTDLLPNRNWQADSVSQKTGKWFRMAKTIMKKKKTVKLEDLPHFPSFKTYHTARPSKPVHTGPDNSIEESNRMRTRASFANWFPEGAHAVVWRERVIFSANSAGKTGYRHEKKKDLNWTI